jgi:hypothetical protein
MNPWYPAFRLRWLSPSLGVVLLASSNCTPPQQTHVDFRSWVVANNSADTLVVHVRYPLDSVQLSASDARQAQQRWHTDSLDDAGRGLLRHPLRRLVLHRGQWYQVDIDRHQVAVNPFLDDTPNVRVGRLDSLSIWMGFDGDTLPTYQPIGRAAYLDRTPGVIVYSIAPHMKQVLTTEGALSSSSQALVDSDLMHSQALVELSITQGNAHKTLLPGHALTDLFRSTGDLPAKDYRWYQRQLTIGPTLQIEE